MSLSKPKKILVVQYSQTGQLSSAVEAFIGPLQASSKAELTVLTLAPAEPYPFPWGFMQFLDVFPESVYLDPPPLKPYDIDESAEFDLIVLAYQVWFLSPSLPITGFLQSQEAAKWLADKPVVTLIACRNMWVMAHETVKSLLAAMGAKLIDNVVLVDRGTALSSFFTTVRWMFTGKKDPFWGFSDAGVAEDDIARTARFGRAIDHALNNDSEFEKPLLTGLAAVNANYSLVQSEKIGYRSFLIWGKLIRRFGKQGDWSRKPVLLLYFIFLITMIATVVPVNILVKKILAPFMKEKHEKMRAYYEMPSGSDEVRMEQFDGA